MFGSLHLKFNKMDTQIKTTRKLEIEIGLNKSKMPADIKWHTSDAPVDYPKQEAKAMLISFFDKTTGDTLKIDLWTVEMQVNEMDRFVFYTLGALADTYLKATNNKEMAEEMQQFTRYFAEKTKLFDDGKSV